jgi:signal transduction histidine kinase
MSEQHLAAGDSNWPDGAVVLTLYDSRVEAYPVGRMAYLPMAPDLSEAPTSAFARGEDLEFRRHDRAAAIEVFRALTQSPDPAIRAGALLRLARNLKAQGRIEEALDSYRQMAAFDRVAAGGAPASLVALYARCRIFDEAGRTAELQAEAGHLTNDLQRARWFLAAPTYWLYTADAAKWTGAVSHSRPPAEILAAAAAVLWERRDQLAPSGREAVHVEGRTLAAIWQASAGARRILVAAPEFVDSQWLSAGRQPGIRLSLETAVPHTRRAVRAAPDTGLPWPLIATFAGPAMTGGTFAMRRRLLIGGFVLLVSMALAAAYLIFRAVGRELAVARLQSDFVAAVSHEFRTPLTTLRQFTDMLRDHDELPADRRGICYEAQSRATDRLTRLVESLLDFGRMEAGARHYRFERRDCVELVRRAVEDFRSNAQGAGYEIDVHGEGPLEAEVDCEAVSRAIWNLLENSVKYSPGQNGVEVGLERGDECVRISIRDHGIGIPAHEQAAIFGRFRRGEEARRLGIKGTGIGLAIVDQIVKAHRGRVEVESRPGEGSTFTLVLPMRES